MQQARLQLAARRPPALATGLFETRLRDVLHAPDGDHPALLLARRYLLALRGQTFDWRGPPSEPGPATWHTLPLLAEAAVEQRHGETWLCWAYPPTLLAALQNPAHWAAPDLDLLARLGSHTALSLYRLCAAQQAAGSTRTSSQPVQWWVDALSPMPTGTTRRIWRQFKHERVLAAIDEINRETDLSIRLIEHKQGRAVVQAQFVVGTQPATSSLLAGLAPVDVGLVLRAEALGLPEHRLDPLLGEFGAAAVQVQLAVLEDRLHNQKLPAGRASVAGLRALLRGAAASG